MTKIKNLKTKKRNCRKSTCTRVQESKRIATKAKLIK